MSNADRSSQGCKPTFPLQIVVEGPLLHENEVLRVLQATQHALDDQNDFSLHHLRLRMGTSYISSNTSQPQRDSEQNTQARELSNDITLRNERALTVTLVPQSGLTAARVELRTQSASLDVLYPPSLVPPSSSTSIPLAAFLAVQLQDLFAEEQALIALTLMGDSASLGDHQPGHNLGQASISSNHAASSNEQRGSHARARSPDLAARLASRTARALKYAPTYHVSISLFSPNAWPSSWEIESAVSEYLAPLLQSASIISKFSIDTQIQLHAEFSPSIRKPEFDVDRHVWSLKEAALSGFINAAEWPLSPSIGDGPTLHFVIFVPDSSTSPLVIQESQTNSWLIPQWGGVFILNPPYSANSNGTQAAGLSKEDIQPALSVFSHQLLSFLGAPQSFSSIPLQLQTLIRVRALSLLLSASSTMGSLARLTVALPSIAIPETVSTAVDDTLEHLRESCRALREGRFTDALKYAKIAETAAERGFFEKSMVGQVYFPDEHKVAVYLPLLGPVGVPLVMSALKEVGQIWTARRSRKIQP